MKVVVVESPAKAKTINKYLGKDYKVLASYGHVRDLPSKDGSVDPENDFEMIWQADSKSASRIKEIAEATKTADKLILATDPDREGEAISWHLLEALEKRKALKGIPVERVVFNAITKNAVTNAMEQPREIDQELADAYLARTTRMDGVVTVADAANGPATLDAQFEAVSQAAMADLIVLS